MTEQHPITPPPELVQQWWAEETYDPFGVAISRLATQAARWGADQELEACCEWLHWQNLATHSELIPSLRATRRPKPPSLKEQALQLLKTYSTSGVMLTADQANTIRRALEALPND
jgi:hypothetical protein